MRGPLTGFSYAFASVSAMEVDPTAGNERLTATTATVLLALLAVEGFTSVRQMLSVHIVVGLLLIPTVALKLASTGYRFARYYLGDAAYLAMAVLGTGVSLLALGPAHHRDFVLGLHKASFLVWFVLMSVHVLVYAPQLPRAVLSSNAWARVGLVAGSVLAGAVLAGAAYSFAAPWLHRAHDHEHEGTGRYFNVLR
jgi:hypothetical protein